MSPSVVSARRLGKWYQINDVRHRGTLSDRIGRVLSAPFRNRHNGAAKRELPQDIWALRDISFDVPAGQVLGILGRNGSGKTTLMKILARITTPTEGQAILQGRVGALLEVGTGFHPDLSGRENIILNGTMIGMTLAEISARQDEIIAFSEVEDFIDTPVKHYSSGMFMRLAFSVAAHLEAEIMLVDEVLAVGDAGFQDKCKRKIRETAVNGRTVLFTSHDMEAVKSICHSCAVLEKGRLVHFGSVNEGIELYARLSAAQDRG